MAVNRYFERTLMPYNPIERPMPFDRILQAGLLKQQSLDNTINAAEQFKEQKKLMGGAQTTQLAQELNKEYFSEADAIQSQLRSGEMTPSQAAAKLGTINTRYNQDQYVKEVLMDQADPVRTVAAKMGIDEDLMAGKAINPNYDYATNTWIQKGKKDIDAGWHAGETNYALLKDPGFLADHADLVAQLTADSMSKKYGVPVGLDMSTRMVYNQQTGQQLEALTEEKVHGMIDDYIYGPALSDPINLEDSDRTSVKYRLARAKMRGEEYDLKDYASEFKRNVSMLYFNRTGLTDQTTTKNAGRQSGADAADDLSQGASMMAIDVATQGRDLLDKYNIPQQTALVEIPKILENKKEIETMFHKHSGPYMLAPGSTMEDPKFVYKETGKEVTKQQDLYAAQNLKAEFDQDLQNLRQAGKKADKVMEETSRGKDLSVDAFTKRVVNKYKDNIQEELLDRSGATSIIYNKQSQFISDPEGFAKEVNSIVESDQGLVFGVKSFRGLPEDAKNIFSPDWAGTLLGDGNQGVYVNLESYFDLNAFEGDLTTQGRVSHMLTQIEKGLKANGYEPSALELTRMMSGLEGEKPLLNIAYAAIINPSIQESVERYMYPGAALQVMQDAGDPDVFNYRKAMGTFEDVMSSYNSFRLGVIMNPENEVHKEIVNAAAALPNDLALKSEEGKVGSGEKAGETLGGVLAGTGASADDYKLTVVYPDLDPQGNYSWYGVVKYAPSGKKDEGVITELQESEYGDITSVSVNLDDKILAKSELDLEFMGRTSDVIRNTIYFMEPEETQPLKIPSMGYGPAINMNITKYGSGFELDGDIYVGQNGEVVKMPIMEYWKQAKSINPEGNDLIADEGTAASLVASALMSTQQVKTQFTYLYDDAGNYLGADIPPPTPEGIIKRKDIVGNTLIANIDEFREAFKGLKGVEDEDLVRTLVDLIGFESANTYSPSVMNDDYSAIGLIQFHRDNKDVEHKTIGGKQYNFVDLARMSIEEQIEGPMLEYFKETGGKVNDLGELYLSIYFPAALNDGYDQNTTFLTIAEDLYKAGRLPGQENGVTPVSYVRSLQQANPTFANAGTVGDVLDNVNKRIQQTR